MMQLTPTPGSDEAKEMGCLFPVMDNAHGEGRWDEDAGCYVFYMNGLCPLHGIVDTNKENYDVG